MNNNFTKFTMLITLISLLTQLFVQETATTSERFVNNL